MIGSKYNHAKLIKYLEDAYKKTYPSNSTGQLGKTVTRVIELLDDTAIDTWRKEVSELDDRIREAAERVQREAIKTISELDSKIEAANETGAIISDKRVAEALQAYMEIVKMDFDSPKQKLQNIQNASYFIWALYAQDANSMSVFAKEAVVNVDDEDLYDHSRAIRI